MSAKEYIARFMGTRTFRRYLRSSGVREYRHFAGLGGDYAPSFADAAMALHESLGRAACVKLGFSCDASGQVMIDGEPAGRSAFAKGKFTKDLSISLWLEDVGQQGFSEALLRSEMDAALWNGWFDANVRPRITPGLVRHNKARAEKDLSDMPRAGR